MRDIVSSHNMRDIASSPKAAKYAGRAHMRVLAFPAYLAY